MNMLSGEVAVGDEQVDDDGSAVRESTYQRHKKEDMKTKISSTGSFFVKDKGSKPGQKKKSPSP